MVKATNVDIGIKFQKSPTLSRTFAQTPSRQKQDIFENNMSLKHDATMDIGKYLKQLDSRLSIPKFNKNSELTDQQKLFKIGNGIQEADNQLRKSLHSSGSGSPKQIQKNS